MKKSQQKKIVRNLADSIVRDCLAKIQAGQVPEAWDGHELRCWLADSFESEAEPTVIRRNKQTQRSRDYRNTIATTNL